MKFLISIYRVPSPINCRCHIGVGSAEAILTVISTQVLPPRNLNQEQRSQMKTKIAKHIEECWAVIYRDSGFVRLVFPNRDSARKALRMRVPAERKRFKIARVKIIGISA
jgi:hypothetical protein